MNDFLHFQYSLSKGVIAKSLTVCLKTLLVNPYMFVSECNT